jgi:hypothetical protein
VTTQVSTFSARSARLTVVFGALSLAPILAVLALFDPARDGIFPPCPLHALTGFQCPGCGGLRATHALLHGDVGAAFALNPLYVAVLPFVLAWLAWLSLAAFDIVRKPPVVSPRVVWIFVVVTLAFGVVRNLV